MASSTTQNHDTETVVDVLVNGFAMSRTTIETPMKVDGDIQRDVERLTSGELTEERVRKLHANLKLFQFGER